MPRKNTRKQRHEVPFNFGIKQGSDEKKLSIPQLYNVKNARFRKNDEIESQLPYSLEENLNDDPLVVGNIIKSYTYKDQIFLASPTQLFNYIPAGVKQGKSLKKVGEWLNAETEDIFISLLEKSALEPHCIIRGSNLYVTWRTNRNVYYKVLDLETGAIIEKETPLLDIGNNTGRYPMLFALGNNIFISMINPNNSQQLRISSITDASIRTYFLDLGLTIDRYSISVEGNVATFKGLDIDAENEATREYTYQQAGQILIGAVVIESVSPFEISYNINPSNTGLQRRFNLWSKITLGGEEFSIYWNSQGYYLVNANGKTVGKFYSDVAPNQNEAGVGFYGQPYQSSFNEVYIPFLVSNNQVNPTYAVHVLKIKKDENEFLGSFAETLFELFLGGLILKYFDGSEFIEYGFNEKPEIEVVSQAKEGLDTERNHIIDRLLSSVYSDSGVSTSSTDIEESDLDYTGLQDVESSTKSGQFTLSDNEVSPSTIKHFLNKSQFLGVDLSDNEHAKSFINYNLPLANIDTINLYGEGHNLWGDLTLNQEVLVLKNGSTIIGSYQLIAKENISRTIPQRYEDISDEFNVSITKSDAGARNHFFITIRRKDGQAINNNPISRIRVGSASIGIASGESTNTGFRTDGTSVEIDRENNAIHVYVYSANSFANNLLDNVQDEEEDLIIEKNIPETTLDLTELTFSYFQNLPYPLANSDIPETIDYNVYDLEEDVSSSVSFQNLSTMLESVYPQLSRSLGNNLELTPSLVLTGLEVSKDKDQIKISFQSQNDINSDLVSSITLNDNREIDFSSSDYTVTHEITGRSITYTITKEESVESFPTLLEITNVEVNHDTISGDSYLTRNLNILFGYAGNIYVINRVSAYLGNGQIAITFEDSLVNDEDIENLEIRVKKGNNKQAYYSFLRKEGNVGYWGNPKNVDDDSDISGLPDGFLSNTNESYNLSIWPPARKSGTTPIANLDLKTYSYFAVYEWLDNKGFVQNSERSLTATVQTRGEIGAMDDNENVNFIPAVLDFKFMSLSDKSNIKLTIYRTIESGDTYRKLITFDNLKNVDEINFEDRVPDSQLGEPYIYADALKFQPPGGLNLQTFENRLWISGFKEFANRIIVSDDRSVSAHGITFDKAVNDSLNLYMDDPIVGLSKLDQSLIIFTEDGAFGYSISDGDTAPVRITSLDHLDLKNKNSLVSFKDGIIFHSSKGIYLLGRGVNAQYIGIDIIDFLADKTIIETKVNEGFHEIYFVFNDNSVLIYNYLYGQWSQGISPVKSITFERNKDIHRIIDVDNNVYITDPTSLEKVSLELETGFFDLVGLIQGFFRLDNIFILGDFGFFGEGDFRVQLAYNQSSEFEDTGKGGGFYSFSPPVSGTETIANKNEVYLEPLNPKIASIKIRIRLNSRKAKISSLAFLIKATPHLHKIPQTAKG